MRSYSSILAFVDLLFNLLLVMIILFINAFMLINPPKEDGKITPPVKLMVTMTWPADSETDIDMWVQGYDNDWIGYSHKDGGYLVLERDDRGKIGETYYLNDEEITIERNYEVVNFTELPMGEYAINVHYYSDSGDAVDIEVIATIMEPFKPIHNSTITLNPREEWTVLSFTVNIFGKITDMRTDIQIPYKRIP